MEFLQIQKVGRQFVILLTLEKSKHSIDKLLKFKKMFVVLFVIILIIQVSPSTFGSLDYGCFHKRNITLYYDDNSFDLSSLVGEIQSRLGDCSTLRIYQTSIQKSVSDRTHENMQEMRTMLNHGGYPFNDILTDSKKQILLVVFYAYFPRSVTLNELKTLQEKGWIIIYICGFGIGECQSQPWLPSNRLFGISSIDDMYDSLRLGKIGKNTMTDLIDVLKNPFYDRVNLAMKIKLESFDKACFSKEYGDVVIHLSCNMYINPLSLLRNAIITIGQFQHQEVKFIIHITVGGFNEIAESPALSLFLMDYGIKKEMVAFKIHTFNNPFFESIFVMKKQFDSSKRHFILSQEPSSVVDNICSQSDATMKDIHIYSHRIWHDPLRQCDNKRSSNIHENIDLYNQEHFLATINDLVCEKSNRK